VLGLIFFGYSNVKDVKDKSEEARNSISNLVLRVSNQVSELQIRLETNLQISISQTRTNKEMADQISRQLAELNTQLTNAQTSFTDFASLSNRIVSLEQFLGEYKLPDSLAESFESYISPFKSYLTDLGFKMPVHKLDLYYTVKKGREDEDTGYASIPYKQVWGTLLLQDTEFVQTPDSFMQTYTHYVLHEGERGPDPSSVEGSLGYYFPASFSEKPEPFPINARVRGSTSINLLNSYKITPNSLDATSWWTNSAALAGLYWELRTKAGKPRTDRAIKRSWDSFKTNFPLGATDRGITAFLLDVSSELDGDLVQYWKDLAKARGVEL
jgi:hypothetical protein